MYLLPSLFTMANMFCGYACIVYAMREDYERAAPFIGFAIATPFPNTILHQRLKRQGRLLHEDWRRYNTQNVVFQPRQMTPRQLGEGYLWAWKQAYSLPSVARRLSARFGGER